MSKEWDKPENFKHGTLYGYRRQGCKCRECKNAASAYQRQRRKNLKEVGELSD